MKLHDTIDVLIGGYMSKDAAEEDYESVLSCGGELQGMALIAKDLEGELSVVETDHMVREGAGALGLVGLALGLAAPPLLATTAIGAALGAGGGKLLHHETAAKIGQQVGETIPLGGAGLIVVYSRSEAEKVEPAVSRAVKQVKGEAEGRHVHAVKGALADAQQKMAAEGGA
jgi:arylsulfatase